LLCNMKLVYLRIKQCNMRYLGLFFIILLISSVSCKKDKVEPLITTTSEPISVNNDCTDIEEPGRYFPGFPNSWWKYIDLNSDTIIYSISSSYEMCDNKCRPVFLNLNKCISDRGLAHSFYAGLGTAVITVSPIYSLTLDSVLTCPVSFATFQEQTAFIGQESIKFKRVTTNLDTSLVINGTNYLNVIEVYEYDKFVADHRYFDYFSRDIGLIRRDSLSVADTSIHIPILTIDNYFIGN